MSCRSDWGLDLDLDQTLDLGLDLGLDLRLGLRLKTWTWMLEEAGGWKGAERMRVGLRAVLPAD